MSGTIYLITNHITEQAYVGQTRMTPAVRWAQHVYLALRAHSDTHLHRAIRKYGIDAFRISVLESLEPALLNERECHWIDVLRPHYNMTVGGEGGSPTDSTRQKLSAAAKQNWATSEHRAKMSRTHVGFTGKQHTNETKQKMRQRASNRPKSASHRQSLRESSLRLWSDPVYRARMIEARRRRN